MTARHQPGMGCVFWTLVFDAAIGLLAIGGTQAALEMVKEIVG